MKKSMSTEYKRKSCPWDGAYTGFACGISITDAGKEGFWIYDNIAGSNLAMYAETERDAFLAAIDSLQKSLGRFKERAETAESKLDKIAAMFETEDSE